MENYDRIPTQDEIISMKLMEGDIITVATLFQLNAVWLNRSISTANKGITSRLTPDTLIRVEDGEIVDVDINNDKPATHVVLAVKGLIASCFILFVQRLFDANPELIKI